MFIANTSTVEMVPSPELADRMRSVYAAMTAGDAERVEGFYSLAAGSVFIGSSSSEFWTDSAQHNADVRPYWQPGNVTIEAGDVHAVAIGETGFSVDRPVFRLKDSATLLLRVSLVWRKEGGAWKVIHSHASVPSD